MEKEKPDNLRIATVNDFPMIEQCLLDEGFDVDRHSFKNDISFVSDVGFFSWAFLGAVPRLRHFYLYPDKRAKGFRNAIGLLRIFEKMLSGLGYTRYVAESPREKPEMERFIKYIGNYEEYHEHDGDKFFIVTIGARRHENLHAHSN